MWWPGLDAKLEVWPNKSYIDESEVTYIQMSEIPSDHFTLLAVAADLMQWLDDFRSAVMITARSLSSCTDSSSFLVGHSSI